MATVFLNYTHPHSLELPQRVCHMVAITLFSPFPFLPEKVHSQPILFSCLLRRSVWSNTSTFCTWVFPTFTAQERSQNLLEVWSSFFFFLYSKAGNISFGSLETRSGYIQPSRVRWGKDKVLSPRRQWGMFLTPGIIPLDGTAEDISTEDSLLQNTERIRAQADLTGLVWLGQFRRNQRTGGGSLQ